jgi:hypothetical protein
MGCKKCGVKKCACADKALTTPASCTTSACDNGETCAQIWSAHCVVWTGDAIVDLDINPGDRMDEIVQKLILNGLNPGCVDPTSSCLSVLNLRSTSINTTTIAVAWDITSTATSYQVEYRAASSMTWLLNPAVTIGSDTIGGLTTATDYYIRVNATYASGGCYSLTIKVTTT